MRAAISGRASGKRRSRRFSGSPTSGRCLLPRELWARGEDYIWYSQGPSKAVSSLAQGYLADMGLPSRFMYAAGRGRPFVINKYDYKRWRIWAGEAMAHHGTALAYHAGPPRLEQEESVNVAPEDYYGPVIRYQRPTILIWQFQRIGCGRISITFCSASSRLQKMSACASLSIPMTRRFRNRLAGPPASW